MENDYAACVCMRKCFLAKGCFLTWFSNKESSKVFAIALSFRLSGKLVHEQSAD